VRLDRIASPVPPATGPRPAIRPPPWPSRPPLGNEVAAVVLTHGQVTGLVTVSDLQQALRRRRLTATRG
jgi:hypothetical protein